MTNTSLTNTSLTNMASANSARPRPASQGPRPVLAATCAWLAVSLSGCATGTLTTGTVLADTTWGGEQSLSKDEQGWNCGRLQNSVESRVAKIVQLQAAAKAEAAAAPPTLEGLFKKWGSSEEAAGPSLAKIKPERDAANSYNAALRSKGCPVNDIDAMIKAATPAPTVVQPKLVAPKPLGDIFQTGRPRSDSDGPAQ